MKQINSFIIEKIEKTEENKIMLSTRVDSECKEFIVQFENSEFFGLTEMPRELEFLLRANDVALSKNLINFLKDFVNGKEISLPFEVYSETLESRPRQPQVA